MNRIEAKRALEHTPWPLIKRKWHTIDHKTIKTELTKSRPLTEFGFGLDVEEKRQYNYN